ncbi:MAG: PEP-CTERM sorting domain-containing protein, partial [Phycisphaerae bacterium]|nr:PEP-CTERM sorting domain-containing protein [Phycisphaerae bacterium]
NVWEWNEAMIGSTRGIRGGAYHIGSYYYDLRSSTRIGDYPSNEYYDLGFRVASVPEPCSLVLLGLGGLTLMRRRRVR